MVPAKQEAQQATFSMAGDDFRMPHNNKRRQHRRGSTVEDDTGSLTYSAGSSINSAGSAAGESTDSSFADIMRVLALQDGPELEALMRKEGIDPRTIAKAKARAANLKDGEASVASSLNYSTDSHGDNGLASECVLQTITGQPSDSYGPDGGGLGLARENEDVNIVFAPADPLDPMHRTRGSPRRATNRRKKTLSIPLDIPPPAPRRTNDYVSESREEDGLWYAKWWMCGFTDALRDLVPKR